MSLIKSLFTKFRQRQSPPQGLSGSGSGKLQIEALVAGTWRLAGTSGHDTGTRTRDYKLSDLARTLSEFAAHTAEDRPAEGQILSFWASRLNDTAATRRQISVRSLVLRVTRTEWRPLLIAEVRMGSTILRNWRLGEASWALKRDLFIAFARQLKPIRDVNLIDRARQELSLIWSRMTPRREYFGEHADQRTGQTSCRTDAPNPDARCKRTGSHCPPDRLLMVLSSPCASEPQLEGDCGGHG